jgi:membrane glycosyltransferase
LLADPVFLARLHFEVWTSEQAHMQWKRATGAHIEESQQGKLRRAA